MGRAAFVAVAQGAGQTCACARNAPASPRPARTRIADDPLRNTATMPAGLDARRLSLRVPPGKRCRALRQRQGHPLRQLFAVDATRGERLTAEAAGVLPRLLEEPRHRRRRSSCCCSWRRSADLRARIDAMFRGDRINVSENRSVLHVALRAPRGASIVVDGRNVVPDVHAVLDRMADFAEPRAQRRVEGPHRQAHPQRRSISASAAPTSGR